MAEKNNGPKKLVEGNLNSSRTADFFLELIC